jgi:16S rRNA (cytosine967-C5)-methyltransferase
LRKPSPNKARLLAYELITQVNREGAFANIRLPELLRKSKLSPIDRNLATEISYGTLRMQHRHDFVAKKFIDRDFDSLDSQIQDLLRMGIHQLTQMRIPDHAAVSETVEVARYVAGDSKASYVNAVLRKVSTDFEIEENIKDLPIAEKLSIEHSHPIWIINAFYDQLKNWDEVKDLLQANNKAAKPDIVRWPGKSSIEEFAQFGAQSIPGVVNGYQIESIPSEFAPIIERRAGVQDRGSQIVVANFLATWKPKLGWLDMCAGPGGKAAYLFHSLNELEPSADFLANEPIPHRAELVKRVVNNQQVVSFDGREPENFGRLFDRILVDAPCTGLGALRRRPEARWRRTLKDLKELVVIQRELLASARQLLNDDGMIAYVTCSPHLSETKAQIMNFLVDFPDMKLVDIGSITGADSTGVSPDGTVQLWSHRNNSDSMFMAILQKVS